MLTHNAGDFEVAVTQSELISALTESLDACIKLIDREGRIMAVNDRGLEVLGITKADDFCGQLWYQFWDDASSMVIRQKMAMALSGRKVVFVTDPATNADKVTKWHITLRPLRGQDGQVTQVLAISTNVTDDAITRELLKDEVDFLQNQIKQRQTALAALRSYMHDVSNLMTSVLASSRLIRRRGTDPKSAAILAELEDTVGILNNKWAGFPNRLPEFMRKPATDPDYKGENGQSDA